MKRDDIKDDEKMFRRERGVRLEGWVYEVLQIHRYNGKHQIHKKSVIRCYKNTRYASYLLNLRLSESKGMEKET